MTTTDVTLFAAATLIGVILSALFSGMETGLYTINRVRLTVRAGRNEPAAIILRSMLHNPPRMLATILVANNIANYMASYGLAGILDGTGMSAAKAVVVNALLLIPLLFVFGEILPKDLFRTHTDSWSYKLAPFLNLTAILLTWTGLLPLVRGAGVWLSRLFKAQDVAQLTARQRVSHLIREGVGAGVLSSVQTSIADRALAMRDRTVADETIPWSHVVTLQLSASRGDLLQLTQRGNFTRYPVIDDRGQVVGIVSLLDILLNSQKSIGELMIDARRIDAEQPVHQALRQMRFDRVNLALVHKGDTAPIGIVTLKDLVEPLTGDLSAW